MDGQPMNKLERIMHELVLNWKLRLVTSAMLSIFGLALLTSTLSGFFTELSILDQTIVGVAVFVVMIPVYLIIADLPKIDEHTIASMLNELMPELNQQADLVLQPADRLSVEEQTSRSEVENILQSEDKLYRFLPNRPLTQGFLVMLGCIILTAAAFYLG